MVVATAALAGAPALVPSPAAHAETATFTRNPENPGPGGRQFTVPAGVTSVTIQATGAGGGEGGDDDGGAGGAGGQATATIPVSPGNMLLLDVGCGG
ncbi:MAG TPA: IPTL-CTERM sorting domain-containing protein, partial [Acidimicrobiia bacterium]|nr:IPTL-CTERM sorting domain-containing protein [Acidimicrobiia bacterium]